ncbi:hypothetical protein [Methylobacter sp. S3L5C]
MNAKEMQVNNAANFSLFVVPFSPLLSAKIVFKSSMVLDEATILK